MFVSRQIDCAMLHPIKFSTRRCDVAFTKNVLEIASPTITCILGERDSVRAPWGLVLESVCTQESLLVIALTFTSYSYSRNFWRYVRS